MFLTPAALSTLALLGPRHPAVTGINKLFLLKHANDSSRTPGPSSNPGSYIRFLTAVSTLATGTSAQEHRTGYQ
ncbi:hypothetical protein F5146DRAFT_1030683 [Armillaria mellea]|nr:hypothetical protein F5146DRAFT_1030683 [Armillaria mellea]